MKLKPTIVLLTTVFWLSVTAVFGGEGGGIIRHNDCWIDGPHGFKNLTLFFIICPDHCAPPEVITMQKGIVEGNITVAETNNSREIKIENRSDDPVLIGQGDVIRGGKQDRVVGESTVVSPHSSKVVEVSCVESDRNYQRGFENPDRFNAAENLLPTKEMRIKIATGEILWGDIEILQDRLSARLGRSVKNPLSKSSLQLTLEDSLVTLLAGDYVDYFYHFLAENDSINGIAYGINGELFGIDLFCNAVLLQQLFPRLLEAYAIEALSYPYREADAFSISLDEVTALMDAAEGDQMNFVRESNNTMIFESDKGLRIDTYNSFFGEGWMHRTIFKK